MDYVAGFLFDKESKNTALIKKSRPLWQRGRYNAIGGKIEINETPHAAMQREFKEECGIEVLDWELFATLSSADWQCYFFRAWGDPKLCQTQDLEEPITVFTVDEIKTMSSDKIISNISWLLPLALNISGGIQWPVKVFY